MPIISLSWQETIVRIQADLYRYTGGVGPKDWLHVLRFEPGFRLTLLARLCAFYHQGTFARLFLYYPLRFWFNRLAMKLHIGLDPFMPLGPGFYIGHPFVIIINHRSTIGANCSMSHEVTLGSIPRGEKAGYPTLGSNVFVGPGAKIIGNIKIGNHAVIGANAVVTSDVPDYGVVGGIPAKLLSTAGSEGYVTNVMPGTETPSPHAGSVVALLLTMFWMLCGNAGAVDIASDGIAVLPVVTSSNATARTKTIASELQARLSAITGAKFELQTGDAAKGIVVGTVEDFPALSKDDRLTSKAAVDRENYLLRSNDSQLLLLGATELAVEHAVWDLLYRFGYRQFFPGKTWEIIPKRTILSIDINRFESPAYHSRSIWFGFGAIPEREADYEAWNARNRATKGIELSTGHAYEKILKDHADDFTQHPEFLALVQGKRQGPKFCISNPGLRKVVVDSLLKQFANDPELDSVSCEPSDGGGWCECADCKKLGSVSDQALHLTNEAARAVAAKYPGKLVGQYAYNEHSPAPTIDAAENVVISIAAGFIKGGFTMDQLIDGWSAKTKTLGIREYYSVHLWDHDMPAKARGAQLDYLQETIPLFHEKGARFYSAESSDNWGCNGLGYYLASRLLWDTEQANNTEAIFDDFLDQAFGPAKLSMTRFYQLINRSKPLESDDLIGRMYRQLKEAGDLEIDSQMRARLDDLVLYTRSCELWMDYSSAKGDNRQAALEAMLKNAWRMRTTGMIHTVGLWRSVTRDKAVHIPAECEWTSPAGKNPWKVESPFTREELDAFVDQGIENRKTVSFETAAFSNDLVSAAPLHLSTPKQGNLGSYQRGTGSYWTWIEKAPSEVHLTLTAGLTYQNQGGAKVRLYPAAETQGESVSEGEAPPDQKPHEVILKTSFAGLHRIELEDRMAGSRIEFAPKMAVTVKASADEQVTRVGRYDLYFYVPKGTTVVGGYGTGGKILSGSGEVVHTFTGRAGYFEVPVPAGEDGKLWMFDDASFTRTLLTVPPQMARSAEELLLPKEVVEKDAK